MFFPSLRIFVVLVDEALILGFCVCAVVIPLLAILLIPRPLSGEIGFQSRNVDMQVERVVANKRQSNHCGNKQKPQ